MEVIYFSLKSKKADILVSMLEQAETGSKRKITSQ